MVSLQQWAITWGILIQYFIQYGASFYDGGVHNPTQGPGAFRIPWAIQIIPAIILFIGLFWFPYSPRWLASKDRWEETLEVPSLPPLPFPQIPTNSQCPGPCRCARKWQQMRPQGPRRIQRNRRRNPLRARGSHLLLRRTHQTADSETRSPRRITPNVVAALRDECPFPLSPPFSPADETGNDVLHRLRDARRGHQRPPPHCLNPVHYQRRHDNPGNNLHRQARTAACAARRLVPDDDLALHLRCYPGCIRRTRNGSHPAHHVETRQ